MKKYSKSGFTLIELLAVIVILAVILAITIPNISGIITNTTKSAFKDDANMVLKAIDYKVLEVDSFIPSSVNQDNIYEKLKLSNDNYEQLTINTSNNKNRIVIIGKGKWDGWIAYGTYSNIIVISGDEYASSFPVLTVIGDNPKDTQAGFTYVDEGAMAIDSTDGDITEDIEVTSNVNSDVIGSYTVVYSVANSLGNESTVSRTVNVVDTTSPVITILGDNPTSVGVGQTYSDAGATALDNVDGDVTDSIITTSNVDTNTIGTYEVTYTVSDNLENEGTATRTVEVVAVPPAEPGAFVEPIDIVSGVATTISWGETTDWGVPIAGENYRLEYNLNSGSWNFYGDAGTTSNRSFSITASAGSTIQFRVRAENSGAASDWVYSSVVNIAQWTYQAVGSNTYNAVYGYGGRWVAIGNSGQLATSTDDGESWSTQSLGSATYYDIYNYSGRWIAVGTSGKVSTSTDGTTWTTQNVGSNQYNAVYNYSGRWVAVGLSGQIATSTNGTDWSSQLVGSDAYRAVYNYNGKWVAVGDSGKIAISVNGIDWADINFTTKNYKAVYCYGGKWIVVGSSGFMAVSTDGGTWTSQQVGSNQLNDIYYYSGHWVAVGNSGTIATSADGTTWTTQQIGTSSYRAVHYVSTNSRWVAVGTSGGIATAGSAADNWSIEIAGTDHYNDVYYYDNVWIAVGENGIIAKD